MRLDTCSSRSPDSDKARRVLKSAKCAGEKSRVTKAVLRCGVSVGLKPSEQEDLLDLLAADVDFLRRSFDGRRFCLFICEPGGVGTRRSERTRWPNSLHSQPAEDNRSGRRIVSA